MGPRPRRPLAFVQPCPIGVTPWSQHVCTITVVKFIVLYSVFTGISVDSIRIRIIIIIIIIIIVTILK